MCFLIISITFSISRLDSPKKIAGKDRKTVSNGCGAFGYMINFDELELYGFNKCCEKHDKCYSICRESKKKCDNDFYFCLKKNCFESFCKELIDFIISLVNNLGCLPYLVSQKNVCVC